MAEFKDSKYTLNIIYSFYKFFKTNISDWNSRERTFSNIRSLRWMDEGVGK
jgi:hypothetical protein